MPRGLFASRTPTPCSLMINQDLLPFVSSYIQLLPSPYGQGLRRQTGIPRHASLSHLCCSHSWFRQVGFPRSGSCRPHSQSNFPSSRRSLRRPCRNRKASRLPLPSRNLASGSLSSVRPNRDMPRHSFLELGFSRPFHTLKLLVPRRHRRNQRPIVRRTLLP